MARPQIHPPNVKTCLDVVNTYLLAVVAPPAFMDVMHRSVYRDTIIIMAAFAACLVAYDVLAGEWSEPLWFVFMIMGAALGLGVAPLRILGETDGYMIAILSAMLPLYGGMPAVIMGVLSGFAGCLICAVGWNVWCNLADAAAGRERCSGMAAIIMHMKRPGERFTTRQLGPGRASINDDDESVAEDGSEYFVPDEASGVPVSPVMPGVSFMAVGVAVTTLLASF